MKKFMTLLLVAATMVVLGNRGVQAAPASGMLLGVYAFPNWQGLRVTDTIPGYSAHGILSRNDVLLRATDGSSIYSIRNTHEIEFAKDRIGPNVPAAIEVFRPGVGLMYLWVEFQPVGGVAAHMAPQYQAEFQTEAQKPGAKAMFDAGKKNDGFPMPGNNGTVPKLPGVGNPMDLFGR